MLKQTKIKILIGLCSILIPTLSFAVVPIPFGWYIEANGGASRISNVDVGDDSNSKTGFGYNANVGYKFIPYLAGEVGYTRYADIKFDTLLGSSTIKTYAGDIAAKIIWPFCDLGFELFTKLGYARIYSKASGSHFTSSTQSTNATYIGVGGEWAMTPNMPVNIQWARAKPRNTNTSGEFDLLSIGIAYIFD